MKNLRLHIIVLVLAALTSLPMSAYNRGSQVKHFVGLWAEAGEWTLLPEKSNLGNSLGGGGALGFTYEMQASSFLFNIGVGGKAGYTVFNVDNSFQRYHNIKEPGGGPGAWDLLYYDCKLDKRKDGYMDVAVQVPVLFGGQWGRFYFLGGVKADISMLTRTRVSGEISTDGQYKEFDIPFRDMSEHGYFSGEAFTSKGSTSFRLNLDASFEIGARLGYIQTGSGFDVPKSKTQYRIAAFVDYGLLDIHNAQNKVAIAFPTDFTDTQVPEPIVADILSTADVAKAVKNLFVGVKFTILFEMPTPGHCVICRDSQLPYRPAGGGRGSARIEDE